MDFEPSKDVKELWDLAERYGKRFGHGIPQSASMTLPHDEIVSLLTKALEDDAPVPGWKAGDEFSIRPRRAPKA